MHITTKQPGSALLTVLLILTALASIMLFATRSALTSTRTLSREDNASLARQMAQSGIDEGLLQVKVPGGIPDIEGDVNKLGSPQGMRRGFAINTDCKTIQTVPQKVADPAAYDIDCPYYDFVVRNYVVVSSDNPGKFRITNNDLITSKPLLLKVSGSGSLQLPSGVTVNSATNYYGWATSTILSITKTASSITSDISGQSGSFVIERPQLVIEATGYAGGIQKKLLYIVPRYPAAPRTEVDFGGSFDSNGFLK